MLRPVSPYAALMIEDSERIMVIADVHLGWEASLAEDGIYIPSQTGKLLKRLEEIILLEKPDNLIILGDLKHTVEKIGFEEWREVPVFLEGLKGLVRGVRVIPGNHDGDVSILLPHGVILEPQQGVIVGDIGLFHGHAWPGISMLNCKTLIIGHVHPIITFRDHMGFKVMSQVWVKAPCNSGTLAKAMLRRYRVRFKGDEDVDRVLMDEFSIKPRVENLIIMPSFNDFLGGRSVNRISIFRDEALKDFMGPILRSGGVRLDEAEIYLLDGTFLGTLNQLTMIK
ncbi:MAG: metallophosphoesterase [Candidatus Methanomethylicia archaeon]